MMQSVLSWVCLAGVSLLLPLSAVLWLHAHGIRPVDEVMSRFRRLPKFGQILILVFVANLIVYGSTKTNQVDGTSSPTNAPAGGEGEILSGGTGDDDFGGGSVTNDPGSGDGPSTNAPPLLGFLRPMSDAGDGDAPGNVDSDREITGFTEEELGAGYAVWRIGTNENWNFDAPPGAVTIGKWLLHGAADDWAEFPCEGAFTGPVQMDTFGRVVWSNRVFAVFNRQLALVPEPNWYLLGSNVPSRAWCSVTPWGSVVLTWQNALLDRDTNTPVNVQAEFTPEGHFIYRYDLGRAGTNLTSVLHYAIQPEDLEEPDRDGDGIPNWEEVKRYHCDPGLVDSDGDGLTDPCEINHGTDPSVRSVPNEEIVARITGSPTNDLYRDCEVITNGTLVAMKLWDGFAADWNSTNDVVFERTLDLGSQSGWQHYFLSSKADGAGDWDVRGMVLEWDDWCGSSGQATASPRGDSFYLPLTNFSSSVTIRLRAIGPKVRAPKPMWLLGYSPAVNYGGGQFVVSDDGTQAALVLNSQDGMTVNVSFDRSWRPSVAPLYPAEDLMPGFSDIGRTSDGLMSYQGDGNSGTLTILKPGEYELPSVGVDEITNPSWMFANGWGGGSWIVVINPSISWGGCHRYSTVGCSYDWWEDEYSVTYNYPLNSKCLWNAWQNNDEGGQDDCSCEPDVKSGAEGSGAWLVTTDYSIDEASMVATGYVKIFDKTVWSDTCEHTYGDTVDEWYGGGTHSGCDLLTKLEECEECEDSCTGGKCNYGEESTLNSVKFRLPLGTPRTGQTSGWIYFESDGPVTISPSIFQWMKRDDANVTHSWSGSTRTWRCSDNRGRKVVLTSIQNGVRLTVSDNLTETLDHTWEITNVNGSRNQVRLLRRNKRDQRMVDETYAYEYGDWSKTDNVTGLREVLHRVNDINGSGEITETRTKYDADDNQLDRTVSVSTRIGRYENAVIRETYFEQDTGYNTKWRRASYWDDPSHAGRHGQLRLLTGNSTPWEYHDWDRNGFETLRVEQRNGSAVPVSFPSLSGGELTGLGGLADATVTVFGYAPVGNDDRLAEDNGRVRCETKYVVRDGVATCVSKKWFVYTHVWTTYDYYPALKVEMYRAADPLCAWNHAENAYSYTTVYDEKGPGVPIVLRGQTAEELDEDGRHTVHEAWENWGVVYDYEYVDFGGVPAQTVKFTERDGEYGMTLDEVVYDWNWWATVSEEHSAYDDQNRLLTTVYKDGTGIENAYSCCRKLWSRDRGDALTVYSAVTGEDKVYYAEEKIYLGELQTNGFEVVQHFMDALGREVRTVTYLGREQGEATNAAVSAGRELTVSTVSYPYGGDDYSVAVDAWGKKTVTEVREYADRTVTTERVHPTEFASADMETVTTDVRNGRCLTETRWGGKWKREWTDSTYDAAGCRTDHAVVETSDYGTVTNGVTRYDFLGRVAEVRNANGTKAYAYDGSTSRKTGVTTTAGTVVRTCVPIYDGHGEEVGAFADGVTNRTDTAYEMDADWNVWRVKRTVQAAEGLTTVRETRERLSGFVSGARSERIDVDENGARTTTVERYDGTDGLVHVVTASSGMLPHETMSAYGLTLAESDGERQMEYDYDAFGRCVRTSEAGIGVREAVIYDALGDAVEVRSYTNAADWVTTTYAYDSYGRQVSTVDTFDNETTVQYDAEGHVVEQGGAVVPVRYGYDALGNRVSLETTKNGTVWDETGWTYDPASARVTQKAYPDASHVVYTYTADGLGLRETAASGAWSERVYDEGRRVVGVNYRTSTLNVTFGLDALGRTVGETNAAAAIGYCRSASGLATNETWRLGTNALELARQYDACGRITVTTIRQDGVPDRGETIAYTQAGRIATFETSDLTATYSYAGDGNETGATLVFANGLSVRREVLRDAYLGERITGISNFVNGAVLDDRTLGYDALGRVTSNGDALFAYDARGQLVSAEWPTAMNAPSADYAYDLAGNFAGQSHLLTADGQVAEDGSFSYWYDDAGRLATVRSNGTTVATYAYDAQGRRVRKVMSAATHFYFYDGWNLVRELVETANGVKRTDYFWGRDLSGSLNGAGGVGGLLYAKQGDSVYVPLYDHNGNVTAYVDGSGAVVARYAYDAFGAVRSATGPMAGEFRFRYSTKYADPESGLVYYGYRHYSPTLRIWLSRDPLGEDAGTNLRMFCNNNPVNAYDALGEATVDDIPGIMEQQHWPMAAALLRKWMSRSRNEVSKPDTTTVSMSWLLQFERARRVYEKIFSDEVYKSSATKKLIAKRVRAALGTSNGRYSPYRKAFPDRHEEHVNHRSVASHVWGPIDDLYASLGDFSFYLLVSGRKSGHCFWIEDIGVYAKDAFEFNGRQILGFWGKTFGYAGRLPVGSLMTNGDFRDWRDKTGKGCDFDIYTDVRTTALPEPYRISLR